MESLVSVMSKTLACQLNWPGFESWSFFDSLNFHFYSSNASSELSIFVIHQTRRTLLRKNLNFPFQKFIYRSIQKEPNRVPKKLYTKFNFSPFIVKNSLFTNIYIYTYKKKNSPRTKNILSSFSFVLPLDIHSWKRSLFPRMQQIEYALRSAQIQRTTRGTNSTYTHSSHSMLTHRLTRRGKEGEREKGERGTHTTEYWFAFLHSVIVLTLLDRIARYVCTYNLCVQRQQIKIKPAKKREGRGRRGVGRMLLEENQSSSVRNRLSSEGDREYNKQRRSLRGRRQSPRRAHTRATTPFEIAVHRFTISKIYPLEGGWFCRESSRERKRHLNSYVPW